MKPRIFSIRRALLSAVLGFLIPLGYSVALSLAGDYTGWQVPQYFVWPFVWPRPLWILMMGRQPTDADIVHGIIFLALANVLLYGTLVYSALTFIPLFRRRREAFDEPPPPESFGAPRENIGT